MKSGLTYDVLIIGGGISACVFASKYLQSNITKKVGLIEVGRGLGGRSSTRISKSFKGWELNHGAPNFNIHNFKNNPLLKRYVDELLANNFIKIDDSDLVMLGEESNLGNIKSSEFSCGNNYLSTSSMRQLSQNIIRSSNLSDRIDFYFETLIVDLKFDKYSWTLKSKNGVEFKSKYLISSTNLLSHKRSLKILNTSKIPLRKAIPLDEDKKIDLFLNTLDKQSFIPRLTFLIYTNEDYSYKDFYSKKYRYFYLNKIFEKKYKFERIIFQQQGNKKLGIVVHSKNLDLINFYLNAKNKDLFKQKIIAYFNQLFDGNSYINKLSGQEVISIMHWRASQPSGCAIPFTLQFNGKYRIGFCGDWFEGDGFGRVEGAILSSLILLEKFKSLN